ncbi:MAG: hypothetical protein EBV59_12490 [Synechococcaceae bacterium WB7_1C_051]|nr:hypothetical protein [Synechococcaceae bacterium WB7_1C_051]
MSDTPLKCTTRHVRIFAATVGSDGILTAANDQLTLDLDPDNEFEWDAGPLTKVQQRFAELVEAAATINAACCARTVTVKADEVFAE